MKRMNLCVLTSAIILSALGCSGPSSSEGQHWPTHAQRIAEHRLHVCRPTSDIASPSGTCRQAGAGVLMAEFGDSRKLSLADASQADGGPMSQADTNANEGETLSPSDQPVELAQAECVERGPLPTLSKSLKRDMKEMPGEMWSDAKATFTNPWNLALLASMGGASIALRTTGADDHVDDHYHRHSAFNSCWADTFGALGNPATHFALAGAWYVAGQQMQDAKTFEVGRKMFSALTITGMSTMFLKVCAWDDAPNGEWGAWPSGHVSSTMAVATVLNHAYGPLVGVPMYGLTALVGIERMDDREHWLSDVVFGAALGWVVAETVMKEHRPEIFGGEIIPYVEPAGGAGIAWFKSLGVDKKPARTLAARNH